MGRGRLVSLLIRSKAFKLFIAIGSAVVDPRLMENSVGKLVVAALLHPEEAKNRALRVNSFTTTPLDIIAEFEKQTGGEKWEVEYQSLDEARESEKKAHEEKNPFAVGFTLRRIWAEGKTLYEKRDNGVIGAEEGLHTLADAVKVAIEDQTGK
jgi:hypothetical protein